LCVWKCALDVLCESQYIVKYVGENHGKISGKFCILPEIFHFFSPNGRIIEKKLGKFREKYKIFPTFSRNFPQYMFYALIIVIYEYVCFDVHMNGWVIKFIRTSPKMYGYLPTYGKSENMQNYALNLGNFGAHLSKILEYDIL